MINVYLVGVDHRIQWIPQSSGPDWKITISDFTDSIRERCYSHSIDLIAEEFSEYLVKLNHAQDSTARRAAKELDLPHLFCDPNPNECQKLGIEPGIENDDNYEKREKEWLKRIIISRKSCILFICGDDHLESFKARIIGSGHSAEIVDRNRGQGWQLIN